MLYLCGFVHKPLLRCTWFDRKFTTCLKGIGIITVVWAHVGKQFGVPAIQFIAGVGVSLFLICSRYGLEVSFQKVGLKIFWKKRLVSVYCPFLMVVVLASLYKAFSAESYNPSSFLKAILLINVNWYLRYIELYYIVFFVIKTATRKRKMTHEFLIWLCVTFILFIYYSLLVHDVDAPFLEVRQVFSFPVGVYIAKNKKYLVKLFDQTQKSLFLGILLGTIELFFMFITQLQSIKLLPYVVSNSFVLFTCLPLALSAILIITSFPMLLNNSLLMIGTISYEVFLVQQQIMSILNNKPISWAAFSCLLVICSVCLHMIDKKIAVGRKK